MLLALDGVEDLRPYERLNALRNATSLIAGRDSRNDGYPAGVGSILGDGMDLGEYLRLSLRILERCIHDREDKDSADWMTAVKHRMVFSEPGHMHQLIQLCHMDEDLELMAQIYLTLIHKYTNEYHYSTSIADNIRV